MDIEITWSAVFAVIGLAGTVFTIYRNFFAAPDERAATNDAVLLVQVENLTKKLEKVLTNDLPHIDSRIESLRTDVQNTGKEMVRLSTIIEERIPRK